VFEREGFKREVSGRQVFEQEVPEREGFKRESSAQEVSGQGIEQESSAQEDSERIRSRPSRDDDVEIDDSSGRTCWFSPRFGTIHMWHP
jgi:hypothetical protein